MVVVHLSSGLGNQLFQYAAGRALALARGVPLTVDPIAFAPRFRTPEGRSVRRMFAIGNLRLPIDIRKVPAHVLTTARGYTRVRQALRDGSRVKFVSSADYDAGFGRLPGNSVLSGYFQDRRYFLGYEDFIVREIQEALLNHSEGADQRTLPSAMPRGVAAVHVRRGDYLAHPEFHPDWFAGYYRRIVPHLLHGYDLERLDIYSDDVDWCIGAFAPLGDKVCVMPQDARSHGIGDLLRMSRYPLLSIANSTFSWWAAAIASLRGATVIAPARWSQWNPRPAAALYRSAWGVVDFGGDAYGLA